MRWCSVNFQCRGVLLIWIRVGQGPPLLAVGAGGGCLDIFSLVYHFSFLSPSLGNGPTWTEILSQRLQKQVVPYSGPGYKTFFVLNSVARLSMKFSLLINMLAFSYL